MPVASDPVATVLGDAADSVPEKFYRVKSNDGIEFEISEEALQQSKKLVDDLQGLDSLSGENTAILIDTDGETLKLVLKWCEENKGKPIPVDDENVPKKVDITPFDENLMDIDNMKLFDLICAADSLMIEGLSDVTCKKVSNFIKGKKPEEIRIIYGIPSDEEEEDEEKVAAELAAKGSEARSADSTSEAAQNNSEVMEQ